MRTYALSFLFICSPMLTWAADSLPQHGMGFRESTPEEHAAWMRSAAQLRGVRPNALALDRLNKERARRLQPRLLAHDVGMATGPGAELLTAHASDDAAPKSAMTAPLPTLMASSVDNSATRWFPPVFNQNGDGACCPCAITYYTVTFQQARLADWDASAGGDGLRFSPRFVYNLLNGGFNGLGTTPEMVYGFLQQHGAPFLEAYPYNSIDYTQWPADATIWRRALPYRQGQSGFISGLDTDAGIALAKAMLANGYLLNFETNIFEFTEALQGIPNDPATPDDDAIAGQQGIKIVPVGQVNHEMTVVGYNDAVWMDINGNGVVDAGEKGAFKIVNQWGAGWGSGGFAWVAYDALKSNSAVAGAPIPNGGRTSAFYRQSVHWIQPRTLGQTPVLCAEVAWSAPNRAECALQLGQGATGIGSPSATWTPAYTGKPDFATPAVRPFDGTMVFDASDVARDGAQRYFLTMSSPAPGGIAFGGAFPVHLTGFRLTDAAGTLVASTTGTNPAGGLPLTVDHSSALAWVDAAYADTKAPGAIDDLTVISVSPTQVQLSFTAPGNDGQSGLVNGYVVRWATAPISSANLSNAGTASIATSTWIAPGSQQTITAAGLPEGTNLHMVAYAVDSAGHQGVLSNQVTVTTPTALAITTRSLPNFAIGQAQSVSLSATGGTMPYSWQAQSGWAEVADAWRAVDGSLNLRGTSNQTTTITLPWNVNVSGLSFNQLVIDNQGTMSWGAFPNSFKVFADYSYAWDTSGPGEDVFAAISANAVRVRWKGHLNPASGLGTGNGDFIAELHPDGSVRCDYGSTAFHGIIRVSTTVGGQRNEENATSLGSGTLPPATSLFWSPNKTPPPGLALGALGQVSGTPTVAGTWWLLAQVTDSGLPTAQVAVVPLPLTIKAGSSPQFTATAPGIATLGQPYIGNVSASGVPTPTFSLLNAPAGMSIAADTGAIAWTPGGVGSVSVTVQAANGLPPNASLTFSITVSAKPGDLNGDGRVDAADVQLVRDHFGQTDTDAAWNAGADVNGDGRVDATDVSTVVRAIGQ